jgi:hypothetical protein
MKRNRVHAISSRRKYRDAAQFSLRSRRSTPGNINYRRQSPPAEALCKRLRILWPAESEHQKVATAPAQAAPARRTGRIPASEGLWAESGGIGTRLTGVSPVLFFAKLRDHYGGDSQRAARPGLQGQGGRSRLSGPPASNCLGCQTPVTRPFGKIAASKRARGQIRLATSQPRPCRLPRRWSGNDPGCPSSHTRASSLPS